MPEKEVQKSQQTFFAPSSATKFTFSFYRVYKRKPQNRFRVRVIQLADFETATDAQPSIYVAQNLSGANGVLSGINTAGTNGMLSSEFVLGITSRNDNASVAETSGVTYSKPIEFYTDEVSTSPFDVRVYQLASASYSSDITSLCIVFEITELEEY